MLCNLLALDGEVSCQQLIDLVQCCGRLCKDKKSEEYSEAWEKLVKAHRGGVAEEACGSSAKEGGNASSEGSSTFSEEGEDKDK